MERKESALRAVASALLCIAGGMFATSVPAAEFDTPCDHTLWLAQFIITVAVAAGCFLAAWLVSGRPDLSK